jgi:hypothetical protein
MNDADFVALLDARLLDRTHTANGEGALATRFEIAGADRLDSAYDFFCAVTGEVFEPRDG